ncbi:MAG: tetratricopeptide repeat protein [Aggregatilineales bacterium]
MAEPRLQRADQLEWLRRLDQEQGNLRAALERAIERQDGEMALRLVGALWRYWSIRIPLSEAQRSMAQVLSIPGGDSLLRARTLYGVGTLARLRGDYPSAEGYYSEALGLFRLLDDQ